MNKDEHTFLTPSQFTLTLKAAVVGVGTLYIPNSVIKVAQQDGWMGCILGAIYPLYLLIAATIMSRKFPKDNILVLSKKCFGNILGNIFNFIFISFFLFILTSELAAFSYVMRIYAASFLKNNQIYLSVLVPIAYIVYKGIKPLGRLNEVLFYMTIVLVALPIATLPLSNWNNIRPVFGSGFINIIKSSKETAFFYTGTEIIFLIYPFLKENNKLFKCGIINIIICTSIYTWTVLVTIFYLGIETSPKFLWPVLALADSIEIPIINSFRFIFISLWALVVMKCIAAFYFAASFGLSQLTNKVTSQNFTLLLYPVIIYLSGLYKNPTLRRDYTSKMTQYYVLFILIFVSAVAIIINFKKGDNSEK